MILANDVEDLITFDDEITEPCLVQRKQNNSGRFRITITNNRRNSINEHATDSLIEIDVRPMDENRISDITISDSMINDAITTTVQPTNIPQIPIDAYHYSITTLMQAVQANTLNISTINALSQQLSLIHASSMNNSFLASIFVNTLTDLDKMIFDKYYLNNLPSFVQKMVAFYRNQITNIPAFIIALTDIVQLKLLQILSTNDYSHTQILIESSVFEYIVSTSLTESHSVQPLLDI